MMLVGIGLGDMKKYEFDLKFVGFSWIITYVLWPLVMFTVIFVDQKFFRIYDPGLYKILMLLSMLPVAANMVAYSAILKIYPEKTALAVTISTLTALFYIPLMAMYFLK